MRPRVFSIAVFSVVVALIACSQPAFAHTTIHVGDYDVEVGWVDEPPIVGQRNAIVVNVNNTKDANATVDISRLSVDVTYGGQTRTLTLQPLSEDSKNQYIAPILPMIPGQYTVQLRGQLDSTNIASDVQPEEVGTADTLAFPNAGAAQAQSSGLTWSEWASVVALILSVAGLVLGFLAFRRARS